MSSTPAPTAPASVAPASACAPTTVRRSSRLAAKPTVSYTEPTEVPDEVLMDRTKAMFETLLEERLATSKRYLYGTYITCQKEFLKLYADLPADNVERIAAEALVRELKKSEYTHPIARKHIDAQDAKRRKAQDDEIIAKIAMEKEALSSLIGEYYEVLNAKAAYEVKLAAASKAIATHAATLNATIKGERSAEKRRRMRDKIYTLTSNTFMKVQMPPSGSKDKVWAYAGQILHIIQKRKLTHRWVVPGMH
jgi:hypothetical protein